jgi:hypothetical protein
MKQQQAEKQKLALRQHHVNILSAIFYHPYITAEQLTRLLYSKGSASRVRGLLPQLETAGYITSRYLPRATPYGSLPKLYLLDLDGFNFLKKQGFDMPKRFRRLEEEDKLTTSNQWPHTVAVNDVLIAAQLLERQYPAITLHAFKHERVLKQEEPITVTVQKRTLDGKIVLGKDSKPAMQTIKMFPDLFLDFRIYQEDRDKPYRCCRFLEIDKDTEGQTKIRRKVRAYLEFVKSGECVKRFGTKTPFVGFINPKGGVKRREELTEWVEAELKVTKEPHFWTEMFMLTSTDEPAIDSEQLFLSPVWYMPFDRKPTVFISAGSHS